MRSSHTHHRKIAHISSIIVVVFLGILWLLFNTFGASASTTFEVKDVTILAPQDLTTEITSMNSTKISLENELSEAEKNILDNKQEQIELYSEINQSIALIASWKKIESLTESLLSVESSLATISLQSENNKTGKTNQNHSLEEEKTSILKEIEAAITDIKKIEPNLKLNLSNFSNAEEERIAEEEHLSSLQSQLSKSRAAKRTFLRQKKIGAKELRSIGSYIKRLVKQSANLITNSTTLTSSALQNGAVKTEETKDVLLIKINHGNSDTILHDCWFRDDSEKINLGMFFVYAGGTKNVPIGDEIVTFGHEQPKKLQKPLSTLGYAGNDIWESDIAGVKTVSFNTALTRFFMYRTNLVTPRVLQIPTGGLSFYGCYERDGVPQIFLNN